MAKPPPLGDHDVGQAEQAEQLRLVLGQPLIARLLVTEQVLDDMRRMLDLGTNAWPSVARPASATAPT
jgi:hypothetical protein